MKNNQFTCPICGSKHFDHIISKTTPQWFGIRCGKCARYVGWLPKRLYNAWKNGNIDMDEIELSKPTKDYMSMLEFFKERGFKQMNAYTLHNDSYIVRLDVERVRNKETGEKIPLKNFIETYLS